MAVCRLANDSICLMALLKHNFYPNKEQFCQCLADMWYHIWYKARTTVIMSLWHSTIHFQLYSSTSAHVRLKSAASLVALGRKTQLKKQSVHSGLSCTPASFPNWIAFPAEWRIAERQQVFCYSRTHLGPAPTFPTMSWQVSRRKMQTIQDCTNLSMILIVRVNDVQRVCPEIWLNIR